MKKIKTLLVVLIIIIIIGGICSFFVYQNKKQEEMKQLKEEKLVKEIQVHYAKMIKTVRKSTLYQKKGTEYVPVGVVTKNEEFSLEETSISKKTEFFKFKDLDFYLKYQDVTPISLFSIKNVRYQQYIPFNENIVSKEKVSLLQNDQVIYQFDFSINLPIIQKDDLGYYVEYRDELFFVKKEDVFSVVVHENSQAIAANEVPVTVYHFLYLEGDTSCGEIICHSEKQIREQFQYLKEQQYFTITTSELLLFLQGKIQLPEKSILITIDDGSRAEKFIPILEEYKINATLFLVTSWYDKKMFASPYMELASHTDNLHTPGVCLGGQGSPLKCLNKKELVTDLKKSREILNDTKAFCYPFYEYNSYAIEAVQEAGFEMGFIGAMRKVEKSDNPFILPRMTMHHSTTLAEYIGYIR